MLNEQWQNGNMFHEQRYGRRQRGNKFQGQRYDRRKMRIRMIDGGMYGSNMDRRTEKSD